MIEFKLIKKSYKDRIVIKNLNFKVDEGEFFVLVGSSGSGKTTTLKMINKLIEPTSGEIYIFGQEINEYNLQDLRGDIGYVLQQIALFPNLTVAENIELIPELKKWPKSKRKARAIELLEKVNLAPKVYMDKFPHQLSGGEQQRIGILRALATSPKIILMDEPFSALDPISRQQLQDLMKSIHEELNCTIVFVTHDMDEAIKLGDRICIMKEGNIMQLDTPMNIQANPANDFVSQFFSKKEITNFEKYSIDEMIQLKLVKNEEIIGGKSVDGTDNIARLIKLLTEEDGINVIVENTVVGSISSNEVLLFIQHLQQGVNR